MASKILKAVVATFLISGSGAAAASSARPLSLAQSPVAQRAGESIDGSSALDGTTEWILAALSLGVIIFGIIHFSDDQNNSNRP